MTPHLPPDDPGELGEFDRATARVIERIASRMAGIGDGNVIKNGNGNVLKNAAAILGVTLLAGAIGFAYGEIFNHEHRISGLEAIEQYKDHGH